MASVTSRLQYDPTTPASGSIVGAYILDADGNEINAANPLEVNLAGVTDLDIRDLTHVSDSVKVGDGTDFLAIAADGSIAVTDNGGSLTVDGTVTVTATQLDIDDLNATDDAVAAWLSDGSGNAIGSTAGALDVNIASGFVDADDSLANTAINAAAVAVSTSLIDVVASPLSGRKWIALSNEGNKSVFIGTTADTAATGFPLHPGMQSVWRIGATPALKIIGETGASSEDVRYLELS